MTVNHLGNISQPTSMITNPESIKGAFLMLSSAFLFAIMTLLIKILGPSYRVWDIAFYRFGGAAILLFAFLGWKQNLFKPRNPRLMFMRGIAGAITFKTLVWAIRLIPLSTAMVIFHAFPAFSAVFSPFMFGDRITLKEILCITVVLIGVAILFDFQLAGGLFGQFVALLGAIFAGFSIALVKKLRANHGPGIIQFHFCLFGIAISLVPFVNAPRVPVLSMEWMIVCGIIFTSITAQLLMNKGFRYCKSWEGGIFITSEVIFLNFRDPSTQRTCHLALPCRQFFNFCERYGIVCSSKTSTRLMAERVRGNRF